jgi:cytochrome c-type biogenesis protein CcmH/NrfG
VEDEHLETPWLLAARAIAAGDFVRAAGIFQEMGDVVTGGVLPTAEARRAKREPRLRQALASTGA